MSKATKVKEIVEDVEELTAEEKIEAVKFGDWLETEFLRFQMRIGKRQTLGDFAKALQISQGLLSHYLKGIRKPREATVVKMSDILGDEIYKVLGYAIPDPVLKEITKLYSEMSEEQQNELLVKASELVQV